MRACNRGCNAEIRLNRTITEQSTQRYRGIFSDNVTVSIHHRLCLPDVDRWRCVVWDTRRQREALFSPQMNCTFFFPPKKKWISWHTCVNLISSHLSGRGKTFRTTAEINQRVGGLVQPVWAGTETEPLEAASGFNDVQWSSGGA